MCSVSLESGLVLPTTGLSTASENPGTKLKLDILFEMIDWEGYHESRRC